MTGPSESEKLAEQIAEAALRLHPADPEAANALIDSIVEGESIWATAVRGIARCRYAIETRQEPTP